MSEELFDAVNERDEVIGQRPRSEIHRLKLNHRAVHVLVFNSRGDLFLQKRSMKKDCFPGVWDSSASGHLAAGESYDACCGRELREEIGLEPATSPERLFKVAARPETGHEFVWVYRCVADGPFRLDPEEIERGDWFALLTLNRWVSEKPGEFADGFVWIWNEMLRRGFVPPQSAGRE
jgi:isopentenyl-diphosphate delta-isomerase